MYSFSEAFSPFLLVAAGSGSLLGIIWGAMPGLSPVMAMAILLGLTYKMGTPVAITFLLSTFIGSNYGGSISAITMNIPGTPDSVPTQMAGFPLAKRGQAGLALGTALTSCTVGSWFGTLALIALVPVLLDIALRFTSWEMALLFLWAVSLGGALTAGESPIKGWISGWVGLLIALIGREEIYGYERFTFGSMHLLLGLSLVASVIGTFGIVEIIDSLSEPIPYCLPERVGKIAPLPREFFRYWRSIVRSNIVGLLIGTLPAAGATMSAFVSYGLGERATGKKFSDGDLEGIVCSEVAGNSNIGGALLPTLVLGIPGSAGTAMFMAALNLHGVIVGPMIEREQPGIMYFIYGSLFVANFAMYFIGLAIIKPTVKLFSLPREILFPIITLICVTGAYLENSDMFDVYVMFGFGLLALVMRKTGFPVAPMILGIILGDMLDGNLRRAMVTFEGLTIWEILSRPIGTAILIILILTFVRSLYKRGK
jgi:putative tricarboxylic transport membrane protein